MSEHEFESYLALLGSMLGLSEDQREAIKGEIYDHMLERTRALVAAGVPQQDAARRVLEEFGDASRLAAGLASAATFKRRRRIMRWTVGSIAACGLLFFFALAYWPAGHNGPGPANSLAEDDSGAPMQKANANEQVRAVAILLLQPETIAIQTDTAKALDDESFAQFRLIQGMLIRSTYVVREALKAQAVSQIPEVRDGGVDVNKVRRALRVDAPINGPVMTVALSPITNNPEHTVKILNAVINTYIDSIVKQSWREVNRTRELLQDQYHVAVEKLNTDREEYFNLVEQSGALHTPAGELRKLLLLEEWRMVASDRRLVQQQLANAYLAYQLILLEAGKQTSVDKDYDATSDGTATKKDVEQSPAIAKSRKRYDLTRTMNQAQMQKLNKEKQAILLRVEELTKRSADLEARKEELERQSSLVDIMGKRLQMMQVRTTGTERVTVLQEAVLERD